MSRTQQEVVDTVAKHLREQGERSMAEDGDGDPMCAYRGEAGRMCAIGCLISDGRYRPQWEGIGVNHSMANVVYGREAGANERRLLRALQNLHDFAPPADFRGWVNDNLRTLCNRFRLVYPEPAKKAEA